MFSKLFGKRTPSVLKRVRQKHLTYLSLEALEDLHRAATSLDSRDVPGLFIEAGCAKGGSAIVLAAAKRPERRLNVYDVFGMIPPPGEADGPDVHARYEEIRSGRAKGIRGDTYYGYEDNLLQQVTDNFARYGFPVAASNVHLIQGLFEETLKIAEPVALAHIDGDWYSSVHACLSSIEPWLVPGGVFVIDDYEAWSGCRDAVDDYFADKADRYDRVQRARLHIVRK